MELVLAWAVPAPRPLLLREAARPSSDHPPHTFPDDIREDPDAGGDLELIGYTTDRGDGQAASATCT